MPVGPSLQVTATSCLLLCLIVSSEPNLPWCFAGYPSPQILPASLCDVISQFARSPCLLLPQCGLVGAAFLGSAFLI